MTTRSSAAAREASLAALADLIDAGAGPGTISIYGGPQPGAADDAVADRPLLARLTFAKPAFGSPHRGAIGARPIPDGEAVAAGRATWARLADGDGRTVADVDVGEGGAALNFSSVVLEPGDRISVAALVLRMPAF